MSFIAAFLATSLGKYIVGGIGVAGAILVAWFRAKAVGRKEQAAKQAADDAKAVNQAKQVQTQVEALKPDDARKELKSWDPSKP